jgi:hypothetical protein
LEINRRDWWRLGVVEAEELEGKCFMVRRGGGRELDVGEIVKSDGGGGGRDGSYVWSR